MDWINGKNIFLHQKITLFYNIVVNVQNNDGDGSVNR